MTPFEEYHTKIYDGTIVSCDKMKKVAEILLERFISRENITLTLNLQINQ